MRPVRLAAALCAALLLALPAGRLRVATDWIDGRLARPSTVQFGLVPEPRLKP